MHFRKVLDGLTKVSVVNVDIGSNNTFVYTI